MIPLSHLFSLQHQPISWIHPVYWACICGAFLVLVFLASLACSDYITKGGVFFKQHRE